MNDAYNNIDEIFVKINPIYSVNNIYLNNSYKSNNGLLINYLIYKQQLNYNINILLNYIDYIIKC